MMTVSNPKSIMPPLSGRQLTPRTGLPLSGLYLSLVGLFCFGLLVLINARTLITNDTANRSIATVHMMMLGTLAMAVLGAFNQFVPVVTLNRILSEKLGYLGIGLLGVGVILICSGFYFSRMLAVGIAGIILMLSIIVNTVNLFPPLMKGKASINVIGLRLSLSFFIITGLFGVTYALDDSSNWFNLPGNLVLAHATFGLIGFLSLAYISVSEKLWPMFLLAHRNIAKLSKATVYLITLGAAIEAVSLAVKFRPGLYLGAATLIVALACHIFSFLMLMRVRKRKIEILQVYIIASLLFLIVFIATLVAIGVYGLRSHIPSFLINGLIASVAAWIFLAIIGHMHKIIPFITYNYLRSHGIRKNRQDKPLAFVDLYNQRIAKLDFVFAVTACSSLAAGLLASSPDVVSASGALFSVTAVVTLFNFGIGGINGRRLSGK